MKKKSLMKLLTIALLVTLSFAGCNKKDNTVTDPGSVESSVEESEAPSEEATEIPSEEATEVPSEEATKEPASEEATEAPTDAPEESKEESVEGNKESNADMEEYNPAKTMYVTNKVNVRKGPGTSYDRNGSLEKDAEVKVDAKTGAWYRMTDGNFVSSKYLTETKPVKATEKPAEATKEPVAEPTNAPAATAAPEIPTKAPEAPETPAAPTNAPAAPTATPAPEIPDYVLNGESLGDGGMGYDAISDCVHEFVFLGKYFITPTCNAPGDGDAQCKKCGFIKNIRIPATGNHNYVLVGEAFEADCVNEKVLDYKCTTCGDYDYKLEKDPNNHVYGGTYYDENGNCYGCGAHIHD